jgi:hypothetical protein
MSSIKIEMTISGQVGKVPLTAFQVTYELSGQDAGLGPQEIQVPAAAAAGSITAQVATMPTKQRLLLICTDEEVTYQINGDAVDRTIEKGGVAIHPGDPAVTSLLFGGNGQTDAAVTIIQMGT